MAECPKRSIASLLVLHSAAMGAPEPPEFTYRLATTDDAQALSHLIGSTWAEHFAYSVTEQDLEDYLAGPVSAEQLKRDILNTDMLFLVACKAGNGGADEREPTAIAAVAQLVKKTKEPCLTTGRTHIEIRRLYLSTPLHGTGAATALVRKAEALARDQGADSLWLGVWEHNTRGIRFYTREGFRTVGEHSFMVGQSCRRDWIMEKEL